LPDRVGGAQGWNFEKAHSILHRVREIVMWSWSENTSCQGPGCTSPPPCSTPATTQVRHCGRHLTAAFAPTSASCQPRCHVRHCANCSGPKSRWDRHRAAVPTMVWLQVLKQCHGNPLQRLSRPHGARMRTRFYISLSTISKFRHSTMLWHLSYE
jgi:hypothetical protein